MKKYLIAASFFASAGLFTACGNKDKNTTTETSTETPTTTETATTTAPLDTMDQNFAMKAASGGMLEVQAANMAMQNSSSEAVKSFAAMMIRDHGKANEELKALAASKNITLPSTLMPQHQQHVDMMKSMKGKAFDAHYVSMMTGDHQEDVADFEKAASGAKDADIKAFATKTLPTLRQHLDSAQALKAKM